MKSNDLFSMEIEGIEDPELSQMQEGITWPALMALNSSFKLENKIFRKRLFIRLKKMSCENGMMPFFTNPELKKKYPPDLECTALFVGACTLNKEKIITDLDDVKKRIMPNGFFETWVGRSSQPIDYTSQLFMCICFESGGIDVGQTLEKIIHHKLKDFASLNSRDVYYTCPLYFIYPILYLKDKGVLPNHFKSLIERFVEAYAPKNEIEASMIQKICLYFKISNPKNKPAHTRAPFFTNGQRQWIEYYSNSVKEVFKASADLSRTRRFNRAMI